MLYANIRVTLSTSNLATTKLCNARFWLGHLGFTIVPGCPRITPYRIQNKTQTTWKINVTLHTLYIP